MAGWQARKSFAIKRKFGVVQGPFRRSAGEIWGRASTKTIAMTATQTAIV
jgi:hypothetical protein